MWLDLAVKGPVVEVRVKGPEVAVETLLAIQCLTAEHSLVVCDCHRGSSIVTRATSRAIEVAELESVAGP